MAASPHVHPYFVRSLGFAGVLGGLLCFIGDMLFYYVDGSIDITANMGEVSFDRIVLSGLLSLPSCWLYLAGCLQVYLAFQPASKAAQVVVGVGMVMIMTGFGMVHANYVAIAVAVQFAKEHKLSLHQALNNAIASNNALRMPLYLTFAVVSLVFIPVVLTRSTHYPCWMCAAYPLLMFLLNYPIGYACLALPNVYQVIVGGYLNLMMVIFFGCSTIALWNAKIAARTSLPVAVGLEEEEELRE